MTQVTVEEAQNELPNLIRIAGEGEEVVILEGEQPVARLTSISPPRRTVRRGSAKYLIHWMSDDFDTPLEDFKEYME
jgi:antitoxin (DNA-binding transcriptional repressor) of toxin-antitoxin stability system